MVFHPFQFSTFREISKYLTHQEHLECDRVEPYEGRMEKQESGIQNPESRIQKQNPDTEPEPDK